MTVETLVAAGLLMCAGATLLLHAWFTRRRPPSLAERLAPFSGNVADEARAWLRKQ